MDTLKSTSILALIIDYYIDLLEEPETLYENAEQTINLFKSFIK